MRSGSGFVPNRHGSETLLLCYLFCSLFSLTCSLYSHSCSLRNQPILSVQSSPFDFLPHLIHVQFLHIIIKPLPAVQSLIFSFLHLLLVVLLLLLAVQSLLHDVKPLLLFYNLSCLACSLYSLSCRCPTASAPCTPPALCSPSLYPDIPVRCPLLLVVLCFQLPLFAVQ